MPRSSPLSEPPGTLPRTALEGLNSSPEAVLARHPSSEPPPLGAPPPPSSTTVRNAAAWLTGRRPLLLNLWRIPLLCPGTACGPLLLRGARCQMHCGRMPPGLSASYWVPGGEGGETRAADVALKKSAGSPSIERATEVLPAMRRVAGDIVMLHPRSLRGRVLLQQIAVHCIAVHCMPAHTMPPHSIPSHPSTVHYITVHYNT